MPFTVGTSFVAAAVTGQTSALLAYTEEAEAEPAAADGDDTKDDDDDDDDAKKSKTD